MFGPERKHPHREPKAAERKDRMDGCGDDESPAESCRVLQRDWDWNWWQDVMKTTRQLVFFTSWSHGDETGVKEKEARRLSAPPEVSIAAVASVLPELDFISLKEGWVAPALTSVHLIGRRWQMVRPITSISWKITWLWFCRRHNTTETSAVWRSSCK